MNRLAWPLVLSLFACLVFQSSSPENFAPIKKRYFVEDRSRMFLKGSSNVNSFTCDCDERFPTQIFEAENLGNGRTRFRSTEIKLTVGSINCRNGKIDRDLQKALRADEFPHIKVQVLETKHDPKQLNANQNGWWDLTAKVSITIAGQTREHLIQAKAQKTSENSIQVKCEKTLQMTQFGIAPPEAMFGLIKVDDAIVICFDLSIRAEDIHG